MTRIYIANDDVKMSAVLILCPRRSSIWESNICVNQLLILIESYMGGSVRLVCTTRGPAGDGSGPNQCHTSCLFYDLYDLVLMSL